MIRRCHTDTLPWYTQTSEGASSVTGSFCNLCSQLNISNNHLYTSLPFFFRLNSSGDLTQASVWWDPLMTLRSFVAGLLIYTQACLQSEVENYPQKQQDKNCIKSENTVCYFDDAVLRPHTTCNSWLVQVEGCITAGFGVVISCTTDMYTQSCLYIKQMGLPFLLVSPKTLR